MSQATSQPRSRLRFALHSVVAILAIAFVGAAAVTYRYWLPHAQRLIRPTAAPVIDGAPPPVAHDGHDHAGHSDAEHADPDSIEISPQAQKNIGLVLGQVERRDFERSITLPAIVAEQPGRSHIEVTTHFTGIVTRIHVAQGQAIAPGQPLFDLRLTHEELIQSQTELLKTAQEMEILDREIARLTKLTMDGGLAGKVLLERQYERDRHAAAFVAQRQALLLHEMTEEQISQVLATKQLIGTTTLRALEDQDSAGRERPRVLQVHELKVTLGQHLTAGDSLAVLADHSELLIEGEAFEQDYAAISRALAEDWRLTLLPTEAEGSPAPAANTNPGTPEQVKLLYIADSVDPNTRTFHFYATLPNRLIRDSAGPDGRRYVQWRHRPGERLRIQVPVERWRQRLAVPVDAITRDGVEEYVFRYGDGAFHRVPVQIEYRDEQNAVLADSSTIQEGHVIAMTAAQQLQLALKNKSGGGIDPHAGHNH